MEPFAGFYGMNAWSRCSTSNQSSMGKQWRSAKNIIITDKKLIECLGQIFPGLCSAGSKQ